MVIGYFVSKGMLVKFFNGYSEEVKETIWESSCSFKVTSKGDTLVFKDFTLNFYSSWSPIDSFYELVLRGYKFFFERKEYKELKMIVPHRYREFMPFHDNFITTGNKIYTLDRETLSLLLGE